MRASGILLPIFSLPSRGPVGNFDSAAKKFIDFLADSGQHDWQLLPLGPVGEGNSPYMPVSCFGMDLMFISPEELSSQGLLTDDEVQDYFQSFEAQRTSPNADYRYVHRELPRLLHLAFSRSKADAQASSSLLTFTRSSDDWLDDAALFHVLRNKFPDSSWRDWPDEYRYRDPDALNALRKDAEEEIAFFKWIQFECFREWRELKTYANERGVSLIGDIPIYPAMDGADSWAHPEIFQYDESLTATSVSGCPPDAFSEEGQLWGNPLYRWHSGRDAVYSWWRRRIQVQLDLFDVIRLDHFRGFEAYYSIPEDSDTALSGHWEKGPGISLFKDWKRCGIPDSFIAENLGYITPEVQKLIEETGMPGMNVLQFAFDYDYENTHLPEHYVENSVVYTGTHDNDTTRGWFRKCDVWQRGFTCNYINDWFRRTHPGDINTETSNAAITESRIARALIQTAMASSAKLAVIPMQDWLNLGSEARINTPGVPQGNWCWRMNEDALTPELSSELLELTRAYGRA